MNSYPYKTIRAGKFTKYTVSITANGNIVVEHYFEGKRKSQTPFENQKAIKDSELPKHVQEVTLWAMYESKECDFDELGIRNKKAVIANSAL